MTRRRAWLALAAVCLRGGVGWAQADRPASVTLDQAVRQALEQNPGVQRAGAEIRRAEAILRQTRAAWLPSLIGLGAYTRLDDDRVLNGRVIAGRDQLALSLQLNVPLVAAPRWVQSWHAADNRDVSRLSADEVRRQVATAVGRAYLGVLAQERLLQVSVRALETAEAHHAFARAKREGGLGTRLDEVRAAEEVEAVRARIAAVRAAGVRARELLGVLMGADGPRTAIADPRLAPPPSLPSAEGEVDRRSDVRSAGGRVQAARRLVRDSWADYLPTLLGVFQPFYQNPPTLVLPTTGWQAQLVLSVPLYDGGLRYGLARERRALLEEARLDEEGLLRQARAEVRAAIEDVRQADQALEAGRRAAALGHEALALAEQAYRLGASTNLEVIDAERRARDADAQVTGAEDAARQARLELLSATGRFP